jgi:hypothetical protein
LAEAPVDPEPAAAVQTTAGGMPYYESFDQINVVNEGSRYASDQEKAANDFDEALE